MKKIILALLSMAVIASGSLFSNIASAADKNLAFATEATYPPFESIDNSGQMQGFEVDIINAICVKMGAKCQLINQPFESLIPSLKIGKFDAIFGALVITDNRKEEVDFSEPFYKSTISLATDKKNDYTVDANGLKGKSIGVQSGTNFQYYLQATYKDLIATKELTIKTYASQQDAFLDLKSGRVDLVAGDTPAILFWLKMQENSQYHTIGTPIESAEFIGTGYGFAVKKGNQQLLDKLNKALDELKAEGVIDQLAKKYFS